MRIFTLFQYKSETNQSFITEQSILPKQIKNSDTNVLKIKIRKSIITIEMRIKMNSSCTDKKHK